MVLVGVCGVTTDGVVTGRPVRILDTPSVRVSTVETFSTEMSVSIAKASIVIKCR